MKKSLPKVKKKPAPKAKQNENKFPVVAIGASAGGLEAVTELLRNLSPNTGMTYVYVQHLSPDHKSILTSLLAKATSMRVQEVKDKVFMQPDHVYVIPPDKRMTVLDGHIKLTPRAKDRVASLPIDAFFTTLADKHKEGAIGIVLSGNANDGTVGLKAIKEGGGLTFAQDGSAKFNSMPKSAIASGAVDFILSPKEIALELTRLSKQEYMKRKLFGASREIENNSPELKLIIKQLVKETNVDFSQYKMATIKRRIYRRMLLNKVKTLKEYVNLISNKEDEIRILFQDLLINVTRFFRDTSMHQYLKTTLFSHILKKKAEGEALRIWVPACSTGEEVYSMAMTLHELKGDILKHHPVQIFASDLSEKAILKARIGEYSADQIKSISPLRLQRFYTKAGDKYQIAKVLREMCVFATHNVLIDPPFSRLDFISCCNLLIYLDSNAQEKLLKTFHYALNPDGYLMLGSAETVGRSTELFKRINNKHKIYLRKYRAGKRPLPGLSARLLGSNINNNNPKKNKSAAETGFDKTVDTILLNRYSPPSVVINYTMEILQFRGDTDSFLRHSAGKASLNVLKMILPEIAFELRHAINQAIKTSKPIHQTGIEFKIRNTTYHANVEVIPLASDFSEPLLLVLFSKSQAEEISHSSDKKSSNGSISKDLIITKLKKDLSDARADMQSYAKDQEMFNEELQHANEEVVSSNEELQSVNEELETSKEEIESTNEELITANQELETRNELLNESYGYSDAIINTIHEPMLILDEELRVKSANKSFYQNFNVTEDETENTFVFDLGNKQWNIPRLRELLEGIIPKDKRFSNFEVTHTFEGMGRRTMLLNASRIIQKGHGEQLILLAINDITELKAKELEILAEEKKYLIKFQNLVTQAPVAICVLKGKNYTVELANALYMQLIGKETGIVGHSYFQLFSELKIRKEVAKILNSVVKNGTTHYSLEQQFHFSTKKENVQGYFNFAYQPIIEQDKSVSGVIIAASEVTDQASARKKMEVQEAMVRNLFMTAPGFICTLHGPTHIFELVNERYQLLFGKRVLRGKPVMKALPELKGQGFDLLLHKVYSTGVPYVGIEVPTTTARDEGLAPELRYFNFSYQPMYDLNEKIYGILLFGYEVTEQVLARNKFQELQHKQTEEMELKISQRTRELNEANELLQRKNIELEKMNHELESFAYVSSHDLQEPLRKIQTFASRILETENQNLSEKGKDYFVRMQQASARMKSLIEDLLAFSHLSIGDRKFEITDLKKMLTEVKSELKEIIDEKDAIIEVHDLCTVSVIPFQFRQLMYNLISNSLKFTNPKVRPRIVIKSTIAEGRKFGKGDFKKEKMYCHVSVSDNGIGFDPQYKDRIFEVFQRLHGKQDFAGTGIGLAIVKKVADNHNGFVKVTSKLNKGATFNIYFPLVTGTEEC